MDKSLTLKPNIEEPPFRKQKEYVVPDDILPKKSQSRFYNFIMYKILPRVLGRFHRLKGQEKYMWDKIGMSRWFSYRIRIYWERGDYIMVIICAIITLYLKEKEHDFQKHRRQD